MPQKKQLTVSQQKNRKRVAAKALYISEFVAVPIPYAILGIVNADEWFVTNPNAWKVGLGGALGLVLMSIALGLVTKKKEESTDKKISDGMISLVIIWYAVAFIFMLLAQINTEIYKIMMWGGLGLLAAMGLNIASKKLDKEADLLKESIDQAEIEINKNKVKAEKGIPVD